MCNLVRGDYSMHESVFRAPDKVGNLYREDGCKGREYDRGGRLLWDGEYHYRYDCEGNLVHKSRRDVSVPENGHTGKKGWLGMLFSADDVDTDNGSKETTPFACWQPGDTCYEWQANGMLAGVRTPDGRTVTFGYDALGRRVSKRTGNSVHRFGWDGNVVLHEWDIEEADRPKLVTDETGREEYDGMEKPDNLVTWVYDGTSFTPVAKVTDGERYTIVHDYLGTPTQAYDSKGELVWEMLLDVYGRVAECHGDRTLVPFRYQGQYEDGETGLYYNRFRYYSPDMGMYISSDPIGLAGNNPTLYGYVQDVNTWMDPWGLDCSKDAQKLRANMIAAGKVEPPYPNAAHHIVLSNSNDWRMVSLRGKMEAFGIDINDADNGIFLPRSSSVKEQFAIDEIAHSRVHTEQYKQSIYDILSPTKSEEEFRQKLKSIRF
ncbi:RHS repeat-associated core domain-containing protein [Bacteroides ovatus]|nr:RHS repeat-associated core domain-containing protein [Bacteroides ovatus]